MDTLRRLARVLRREEGQGLLEYALILGLIAVVVVSSVTVFGSAVVALYQSVIDVWP